MVFLIFIFLVYIHEMKQQRIAILISFEKKNIRTLIDQGILEDELELKLNKEVDVIFISSTMDDYFRQEIEKGFDKDLNL